MLPWRDRLNRGLRDGCCRAGGCAVGWLLLPVMLASGQAEKPSGAPAAAATAVASEAPSVPAVPAAGAATGADSSSAPTPAAPSAPLVPWEYSPYQIRVWLAAEAAAELDAAVLDALRREVARRADAWVGAPWTLIVSPPPSALASTVAYAPELLTDAAVGGVEPQLLNGDKLFLVSLRSNLRETQIRVRELDCHTRTWSRLAVRDVRQPSALGAAVFDALQALFSPVARIEEGSGKTCVVRARAAGLVESSDSPAYLGPGDVLVPILRQNDRYGDPLPKGIQVLPFTYLQVASTASSTPSLLVCNIHSGMRSPISGRSTLRRERWAVKALPTLPETELIVESKPYGKKDRKVPLPGIEVFAKSPLTDSPPAATTPAETEEQRQAAEKANPAVLLGVTDWRGSLRIPRSDTSLRIMYIRNGGLLLARLPIVAGLSERLIAEVSDDNPRLQAEGFVKGMNGEITDLVVQRQLLRARIRKKITDGKLDEAQQLLDEFRGLKSLNDLQRMLDQQMTRQKPTFHPGVQQRVDKLYADERELIAKNVDVEMLNLLTQEVATARTQPVPPPVPEPSAPEPTSPTGGETDALKKPVPGVLQRRSEEQAASSTTPDAAPAPP